MKLMMLGLEEKEKRKDETYIEFWGNSAKQWWTLMKIVLFGIQELFISIDRWLMILRVHLYFLHIKRYHCFLRQHSILEHIKLTFFLILSTILICSSASVY